MKKMMLVCFWALASVLGAQDISVSFLNYGKKMPADIRSKSVVVYVYVSDNPGGQMNAKNPETGHDAATIIDRFHTAAKKIYFDPAAYFIPTREVRGQQERMAALRVLEEKKAGNVVIIYANAMVKDEKLEYSYNIVATKYNGKETFFDHDQPAYNTTGYDFDKVLKNFTRDIEKTALPDIPLETSENPNIITLDKIMAGKRINAFAGNIKGATFLLCEAPKFILPAEKPKDAKLQMAYHTLETIIKDTEIQKQKTKEIMDESGLKYSYIAYNDTLDKYDTGTYLVELLEVTDAAHREVLSNPGKIIVMNNVKPDNMKPGHAASAEVHLPERVYYYYYLRNTKTNDIHFVEYGDPVGGHENQLHSLKAFLKLITEQE